MIGPLGDGRGGGRGDGLRPKRVAESVRVYLSHVLGTQLHDPRLSGVIVTRVEVTADLSIARVFVRRLTEGSDKRAQDRVVQGLRSAAARLRRGLGPKLGLKRVPELSFRYDTGMDAATRVEQILDEIHSEQPSDVDADPHDDSG